LRNCCRAYAYTNARLIHYPRTGLVNRKERP